MRSRGGVGGRGCVDVRATTVGDQKERGGKLGQHLVKRVGGLLQLEPKKKKRGSAGLKRRKRRV
jgi:hypothetical protein